MNPKITSLLGFAMRAGKVICGKNSCLGKVKKIKLIVFAEDIHPATVKDLLKVYKGKVLYIGLKNSLGDILGRESLGVIGITDEGFARAIELAAIKAKE